MNRPGQIKGLPPAKRGRFASSPSVRTRWHFNRQCNTAFLHFLKSLKINSKRFSEIIETQNISAIHDFNQALIHSSGDKIINYEKLEFYGDAVLRLA
ncbi:MAG: hypothetical protein VX228_10525, partial [Pseudomonadota bacterium]|nr:hypothetical protein [Pseudomonadota bacterium]